MSKLSATQKADAYDSLIREIRHRQPSVDLAIEQRGGYPAAYKPLTEIERFLVAFDTLTDRDKQRRLGDA